MLIQNSSNTVQAPQPAIQPNDRLAVTGGPVVVVPNKQAASVDLPKNPTKPVTNQPAADLQSFVDSINNALKQANKKHESTTSHLSKESLHC